VYYLPTVWEATSRCQSAGRLPHRVPSAGVCEGFLLLKLLIVSCLEKKSRPSRFLQGKGGSFKLSESSSSFSLSNSKSGVFCSCSHLLLFHVGKSSNRDWCEASEFSLNSLDFIVQQAGSLTCGAGCRLSCALLILLLSSVMLYGWLREIFL